MPEILIVDDRKEEKFLRQKAANFDFSKHSKKDVAELVKTLRETMKKADGIGLSANQIGLDLNVFVTQTGGKFYAVFNPQIIKRSKETVTLDEGCLSVPKAFGGVERSEKIILAGQDRNGKKIKIKTWGMLARIFQHEVDHLNGILFIDRTKNVYKISEIPSTKR